MLKGFSLPLIILGLVLFLFGFIAVTAPNMTPNTLMFYLAYMLLAVGGVSGGVGIIIRKSNKNWFVSVLMGLAFLTLGITIIVNDGIAATFFTQFIAAWAALMGLSLIASSFFQKQLRIILVVNGLMSLGFGIVIYLNPFSGSTLNFMIGFYTILLSIMVLYLAFRFARGSKKKVVTEAV
jgi:uncharacterized membrane protein HdeD (DUF308 family)